MTLTQDGAPQAPPAGPRPASPPPEDFLIWSVLAAILCFPPTGAGALLWARQVRPRHAAGDLAGAQEAARQARGWLAVTVGCGLALYGSLFVTSFLLGATNPG